MLALGSGVVACSTPNPDGIVQNGVEAQMREKEKFINACYEAEYKKASPRPKGVMVYRLTITEDGFVKDIQTLEDGFKNEKFSNCLKFIIKNTTFDHAGITMETFVDYPLVFNGAMPSPAPIPSKKK